MELQGWGRYPRKEADFTEPVNTDALQALLKQQQDSAALIARGAGRSYGDSALADKVVGSRFLDSFIALDDASNSVHCGAGVTLEAILKVALPRGLFLPVLPGTRFVSIGGAIAADIHGKNHHRDGSFCDHLIEFGLMLASGEAIRCSREHNAELFHASCGGMGLTGVVLDAVLRLERVSSNLIERHSLPAANLKECFELIEEHDDSKYSVAWLDCLASGDALGRSVLHLGEHLADGELRYHARRGLSVPFSTPAFLLNKHTMSLFNSTLFRLRSKGTRISRTNYDAYFFPLDNIGNWNRLYGSKGFLQYQFVLPVQSALQGMQDILARVAESGKGSFLSVLKKFGKGNANLLSFPMEGYTLTLDFKFEKSLLPLLDELDAVVIDNGGRHYLAKDARMSEAVFKAGYPNWEQFLEVKHRVDPSMRFSSLQSRRLGLS